MAFGFGVGYAWLQTLMSFRMIPLVNSRHIACVRLMLSMLMTCTFMTSSVCGPMAFKEFHGADPTKWGRRFITHDYKGLLSFLVPLGHDGGWHLHVVSTVCEWVSALSLDSFILTFAREMHLISISSPRVTFVIERLELPTPDTSLPDREYSRQRLTEEIRFSGAGHESFTSNNSSRVVIQ